MSKKLTVALKVALANEFVTAFIAHSAHWNVEGATFQELHNLFGNIYGDLNDDIDIIAEHIRASDEYAPISIKDLLTSTTVKDLMPVGNSTNMVKVIQESIAETKTAFDSAFKIAETEYNQGVMDYLSGRLTVFAKYLWMLRAIAKE